MNRLPTLILEPLIDTLVPFIMILVGAATPGYGPKQVAEVSVQIPEYEITRVEDPEKFLNDLMLSPYWSVVRDHDGHFIANPHTLKGRGYLLLKTPPEPSGNNASCSAQIRFTKPKEGTLVVFPNQATSLPIYDTSKDRVGLNSYSSIAIQLHHEEQIFLIIGERGADSTRQATINMIRPLLEEIQELTELPTEYRTSHVYADFYAELFESTKDAHQMHRLEGIQGRDTFYGYFRTDL